MAIDVYRLGGQGMDTLAGRAPMMALDNGASLATTAGRALLVNGASYQVTAGKTFYITGLFFCTTPNGAPTGLSTLSYADNAVQSSNRVSLNSSGIPRLVNTNVLLMVPFYGSVPATKFLGQYNPSGADDYPAIVVFGYEA